MIYGKRTNGGEHGTVYTNIEAVNFILTLSGLNSSSDFLTKKILDPSVGDGAFIIPLIERIVSCFSLNLKNHYFAKKYNCSRAGSKKMFNFS